MNKEVYTDLESNREDNLLELIKALNNTNYNKSLDIHLVLNKKSEGDRFLVEVYLKGLSDRYLLTKGYIKNIEELDNLTNNILFNEG